MLIFSLYTLCQAFSKSSPWQLSFSWEQGVVRVQILLFFSKCLSGPGRQVQSLGKSRNAPCQAVKGWMPALHVGMFLLLNPQLQVRERGCHCSKASKKIYIFFFFCKTFESDLITVKFSFLTICCINLRVLHSWAKVLQFCTEIPWGGSCTQLYSSEMGRCFRLMSCKYRLVKNAHFQIFLCTDRAETQPAIKRFVVSHAVGLLCRGSDSSYNDGKSEGLSVCCWGQGWFALLFFCITCSIPVVTLPPVILFLSCIRSSCSFALWAQSPARWDPRLCRCHFGGDAGQCQLLKAEAPALGPAAFGRRMGRSTALVHGAARSPKLLWQDVSEAAAAASQQCLAALLPWETACLWQRGEQTQDSLGC